MELYIIVLTAALEYPLLSQRNDAEAASELRRPDLSRLQDRFRSASAASNDCLWEWDLTTGAIERSDAMATRFGYSPEEIDNTTDWWRDRIHPEDRGCVCDSIDSVIADGGAASWTYEYRFRRRDGTYAEVCDRAYMLRDETGRVSRVVGAVMDLSEIKDAYRALEESEERYRYTIELTGQIAWSATADGQLAHFDQSWSALTGLDCWITPAEWEQVAHPDDLQMALQHWAVSVETGQPLDFEHRMKLSDGSFRWFRSRAAAHKDSSGRVVRWYGTIEDIDELKSSQLALKRLASHDDLTTLGNRHMFSADLEAAMHHASGATTVGLLVLDIDDFKSVNDLFGHDAGDLLLMSFARRMIEANVELYRIGGDEFAAIVRGHGSKAVLDAAHQIHRTLETPFHLGGTLIDCRTSIGCAVFPSHGSDSSELLKSADIALYAAKAAGRGQTRLFQSTMRSELQKRKSMLDVARSALAADEIEAFFQPKVCLRTGQIVGFEALMRVQNDRFGPQRPAVIRAAFDDMELSVQIADKVLAQVMLVAKAWRRDGLNFGHIAINASPLEFRGGKYAERLLSRLEAEGVSPRDIEVEVTETVFLERDDDSILESLQLLKRAGITVALDDFGTGYASLSHLKQYPVDVLKIDRSFVRGLITDARQELITKAIIDLSRTMGIQTVAEGIERQEQANLLRSFGCDIGQGFLFGRAMPAKDAAALLHNIGRTSPLDSTIELRAG